MRASIVDLRYRMKDVLAALDRGETVVLLYRGKERAALRPLLAEAKPLEAVADTASQSMFGMWRDREDMDDPTATVRAMRQSRRFVVGKAKSLAKQRRTAPPPKR